MRVAFENNLCQHKEQDPCFRADAPLQGKPCSLGCKAPLWV